MALRHRHIENLLQIPPQMIDDRERKPILRLAIEQILQLVAPEAGSSRRRTPHQMNGYPVHVVLPRRVLPLPAVVGEIDILDELAESARSLFSCRLAFSSADDPVDRFRGPADFVMFLMKPRTRLLRLPSTHHMPIHRPRCFLTPPVWCRLRIDFSLCAFRGSPYWRYSNHSRGPACSFRSIQASRVSRRTSLRRPRRTAGRGRQPGTRPAMTFEICAFEQCSSSATAVNVRSPKSSRGIELKGAA